MYWVCSTGPGRVRAEVRIDVCAADERLERGVAVRDRADPRHEQADGGAFREALEVGGGEVLDDDDTEVRRGRDLRRAGLRFPRVGMRECGRGQAQRAGPGCEDEGDEGGSATDGRRIVAQQRQRREPFVVLTGEHVFV